MFLFPFQLLPGSTNSLGFQPLSARYGYDKMSVVLYRRGHTCLHLPILSRSCFMSTKGAISLESLPSSPNKPLILSLHLPIIPRQSDSTSILGE